MMRRWIVEGCNNLSNDIYTNDESWAEIAEDFEFAHGHLPVTQEDKGRPTGCCRSVSGKTYLYKAYRQDNDATNEVTSINAEDLLQVVKYTDKSISGTQADMVWNRIFTTISALNRNMRMVESLWAMQYP